MFWVALQLKIDYVKVISTFHIPQNSSSSFCFANSRQAKQDKTKTRNKKVVEVAADQSSNYPFAEKLGWFPNHLKM